MPWEGVGWEGGGGEGGLGEAYLTLVLQGVQSLLSSLPCGARSVLPLLQASPGSSQHARAADAVFGQVIPSFAVRLLA